MKILEENIYQIFNLQFGIEKSLLRKTKFHDKIIEEKFEEYINTTIPRSELLSCLLTFLGYVACLSYIVFAFYRPIPLIICLTCFSTSIILSIVSYFSYSISVKIWLRHILIFLSSFNFFTKAILVCYHYTEDSEDQFAELLRILIYDFISVNIYMITKLEADFKVSLFYFFMNILITIIAHINSQKNHFYFLEGFTSFFVFIIFYIMRKEYDLKLREIFLKQYKIEFLYDYTLDYIMGLNGYVLHARNNEFLLSNKKISELVKNIYNNKEEIKSDNPSFAQGNVKKYDENIENINNPCPNDDFSYNQEKIYKNSDKTIVLFLKNLIFYENYESNCVLNLLDDVENFQLKKTHSQIKNDDINEKPIQRETNNNILKSSKDIHKSLFEIIQILDNKFNLEVLSNSFLSNSLFNMKMNFIDLNQKKKNIYTKSKIKNKTREDIINDYGYYSNLEDSKVNFNLLGKNSHTYSKNEKFGKNLNGNFKSLGIFYLLSKDGDKKYISYYDVFHRRIYYNKSEYVDDFYFNDVSDLFIYKQNIINDNVKRQKIFAKIAHEFKTPLNSIIGIVSNIQDSELVISSHTKNNLNIINNLSNYLIFLISDIINYVNIINLREDIILNKSKFKFKECLDFCFALLKTLIECNNNKKQNIKCDLKIEDSLSYMEIALDEWRIKQILLNFISNAIKYTNRGSIILKAKKKSGLGLNLLKISVKDTGIGIEESCKKYLFTDFKSLEKKQSLFSGDTNLNIFGNNSTIGSGFGLSICKYLCQRMNIFISYKSKSSIGSKFYIEIPENFYSINVPIRNDNNSSNGCCISVFPAPSENFTNEDIDISKNMSFYKDKFKINKCLSFKTRINSKHSSEKDIQSLKYAKRNNRSIYQQKFIDSQYSVFLL